jgi:hypothetical protein
MKPLKFSQSEYNSAAKSVEEIHKFYLIVFVYILMMGYLHWLDLQDGTYDWAFWPAIGFTLSLLWFAAVMLPFKFKRNWILNEIKRNHSHKSTEMNSTDKFTIRDYEKAQRRVEDKIGFYIHLSVFVVANSFFIYLSLSQSNYFWAKWTLLGWGIGVFSHGFKVFSKTGVSDWKRKLIEKEIEKQRRIKEKF